MKHKYVKRFRNINNNQGVALVIVIMVFVVMTILGTSAVSMVYSDNMFSQQQEDGKKAHYAARAAVASVEQAIHNQVDILDSLQFAMDDAITEWQKDQTNDDKKALMDAAVSNYNLLFDEIYDEVLPTTTILKHKTKIAESLETDSVSNEFVVEVQSLGSDNYKLSSVATVNGKKGNAVRVINIKKNDTPKTIQVAVGAFDDALYAYNDIDVDSDNEDKNKVKGGVTYGKGPKPVLTVVKPNILPDDPRDPNPELKDAKSAFEEISAGTLTLTPKTEIGLHTVTGQGSNKNYKIDYLNSGYYASNLTLNGDYPYNVDTSKGDVILRFDAVVTTTNKPVVFNASGGGNLIIYIDSLTNSGQGNNFEINGSDETSSGSTTIAKTDIYVFIKTNDALKNNFDGNNAFIYAPTSTVQVKNGTEFKGSIVADQILMKNNGEFAHSPSKLDFNPYVDEEEGITTKTLFTIKTLTYDPDDPNQNYWTKK